MEKFEALNVAIESLPDKQISETHTESGGYKITAVNAEGKTRVFQATALNLNGFAFATSGMSIGEYRETVIVEQELDGGYLNLDVTLSEEN